MTENRTRPPFVTLELRVDKFDGRTLTDEGNYPTDSRIGRLFYGQGRAERVVIHEATGDTRTYTYVSEPKTDPFDEFARADLEAKGVDPAKAAEVVENTYGDDSYDPQPGDRVRLIAPAYSGAEATVTDVTDACVVIRVETGERKGARFEVRAWAVEQVLEPDDERELREARLSGFTDEALRRKADETDMPGPKRRAEILLRLDTPERRARASAEGHTLTNLHGGRPSDNLANAVAALQRAIDEGREGDELYGERTARRHRERERQFREENPAAASAAFERSLDNLR